MAEAAVPFGMVVAHYIANGPPGDPEALAMLHGPRDAASARGLKSNYSRSRKSVMTSRMAIQPPLRPLVKAFVGNLKDGHGVWIAVFNKRATRYGRVLVGIDKPNSTDQDHSRRPAGEGSRWPR